MTLAEKHKIHQIREPAADEHPQFLRTHSKARTAGIQEKRPDRHTLAVGLCPPRRRLVFAARHHLAEAELYAGERERPMHEVT